MRKITLFVSILFISLTSFAQLEVKEDNTEIIGTVGALGSTSAEIQKEGDTYLFLYKDIKFQHINEFKSFQFESLDDLYSFMSKGMEDKRKDEEEITLDGVDLKIDFTRMLGTGSVQIQHYENGNIGITQWFTQKQLDKLFGKS